MDDNKNLPTDQLPDNKQQVIVADSTKRNWTSYIKEFLMLFLAITFGFFVENKRGEIIERDIERSYMNTMLEDLKSDTLQLSHNFKLRQKRVTTIDSLIFLFSLSDYSKNMNDLYYLGRNISLSIDFFPNDRTIVQLKSSGSLRLVQNADVSNSIMSYDQKMRLFFFQLTHEQQIRSEYRKFASMIFNDIEFNNMVDDSDIIKRPSNNPKLFNTDRQFINELINYAQYLKKLDYNQIKRAKELKQQASDLIIHINKAYSFNE